ncbi:hypothetical protein FQZ97_1015300 [compost metagenome]
MPPGIALALWVGHEELILARDALAGFSNSIDHLAGGRVFHHVEGDHPAGDLAALGDQRAPLTYLLHVLQADKPGSPFTLPQRARPLDHYPGEVADFLLARLPAGCLAVMRAVRGGVQPAHRPARH